MSQARTVRRQCPIARGAEDIGTFRTRQRATAAMRHMGAHLVTDAHCGGGGGRGGGISLKHHVEDQSAMTAESALPDRAAGGYAATPGTPPSERSLAVWFAGGARDVRHGAGTRDRPWRDGRTCSRARSTHHRSQSAFALLLPSGLSGFASWDGIVGAAWDITLIVTQSMR
ncbi:hypothetical protein P154DRAFT_536070 [Amniculicola lignicola CBS 123094]|uniref:Uncharacterized protein n=1 Tax=Amniculicola lignicola CBS 123094 TaxID=1392246 RepID=A0A6A5WA23_9PLEO|nr:hypothetical protein P154DRAFT_536070 [Amniculicola lignicola CBS 123094]